ncbi:MAG: DUF1501 domain-containing protein [Methylococcales bacterium]|nr:DUF1501 domain-containing protein [Methylococcales bacterium]
MSLTRRRFIRNMLAAPVIGGALLNNSALAITSAQSEANALGKTLVVIFQRGGCDGLNVVVPYGDADYYSARGNSIAINPAGEGASSALDLDGFFGLHPSMSAMHKIFQEGGMAVMPTVSWEHTNRSHFKNQPAIESGGDFSATQGWLNRHLQSEQRDVPLRAVALGSLSQALRGNASVSTINNLAQSGLGEVRGGSKSDNIRQFLNENIKRSMKTSYDLDHRDSVSRHLLHQHGRQLLSDLEVLAPIDPANYQVENGAVYSKSKLAKQLKDAAQLIKSNIGVEVISISNGGWDTHTDQGGATGNQARKLTDFSDSIGAFYQDMGDKMNDVMILTMSEFGRSLKPNGNLGTDHGHAAAWFVIGQSITGGVYGEWPGLSTEDLNRGRYLSDTVDFRNIMGDILITHLNNPNIDQVLPGFTQHQNIGFLS